MSGEQPAPAPCAAPQLEQQPQQQPCDAAVVVLRCAALSPLRVPLFLSHRSLLLTFPPFPLFPFGLPVGQAVPERPHHRGPGGRGPDRQDGRLHHRACGAGGQAGRGRAGQAGRAGRWWCGPAFLGGVEVGRRAGRARVGGWMLSGRRHSRGYLLSPHHPCSQELIAPHPPTLQPSPDPDPPTLPNPSNPKPQTHPGLPARRR